MISQKRLVGLLRGLPAVHLDIFDVTHNVTGDNGEIDAEKISFLYKEVESAISQAESYAKSTREIVQCLSKLGR